MTQARANIFLTGFSTTGKSTVARGVAALLGWSYVDTDAEVERLAGKSIPDIFVSDGEARFRELESQALRQACRRQRTVAATGGGAILDPANRDAMAAAGMVVCLEAKAETIYARLQEAARQGGGIRPLLAVADPLRRIAELKQQRQHLYALADWTVHTDHLTIPLVCQEVVHGWRRWRQARWDEAASADSADLAAEVVTPTDSYPVLVGEGLLAGLGERLTEIGLHGSAFIVSDNTVFPLYGAAVEAALRASGFAVRSLTVPAGEGSKTLDNAQRLYRWLAAARAERQDVVVALGGGVVGDLAGFVAATYLRGLALVQAPTTLTAMVDASIGGKTGVDLPQAKNLVGSFYQPRLVAADVSTLATLPRRELMAGWAEVVKHAMILDASYFESLEREAGALLKLGRAPLIEAIRRSAAIKAAVVSEDEKEGGKRTLLNYGHTIAHGLEAATGYRRLLHGEAVAIGMAGAAAISRRMGLLPAAAAERQAALLRRFGLPLSCPGIDSGAVREAMKLDKKVKGKAIRWVLLEGLGRAAVRQDVPEDAVTDAISQVVGR